MLIENKVKKKRLNVWNYSNFCFTLQVEPEIIKFVDMKNNQITSFLRSAWRLYADGFRQMTVGKTLWVVILIKLFIIFFILKLFFFPDYIGNHAEKGQEAEFVAGQTLK